MHFGFGGGGMRFENGMGVFFRGSAQGQGRRRKKDKGAYSNCTPCTIDANAEMKTGSVLGNEMR